MINWKNKGLVLSSTNYSETSLILKVFTDKHGIRKGLVKGGKVLKKSNPKKCLILVEKYFFLFFCSFAKGVWKTFPRHLGVFWRSFWHFFVDSQQILIFEIGTKRINRRCFSRDFRFCNKRFPSTTCSNTYRVALLDMRFTCSHICCFGSRSLLHFGR